MTYRPDVCPTCGRTTPPNKRLCPYCPLRTRIAQALGCAAAYVLVFGGAGIFIAWIVYLAGLI